MGIIPGAVEHQLPGTRRRTTDVTSLWTLGYDAEEPRCLAAFWALALGYAQEPGFDGPDNASIVDPDGYRLVLSHRSWP